MSSILFARFITITLPTMLSAAPKTVTIWESCFIFTFPTDRQAPAPAPIMPSKIRTQAMRSDVNALASKSPLLMALTIPSDKIPLEEIAAVKSDVVLFMGFPSTTVKMYVGLNAGKKIAHTPSKAAILCTTYKPPDTFSFPVFFSIMYLLIASLFLEGRILITNSNRDLVQKTPQIIHFLYCIFFTYFIFVKFL